MPRDLEAALENELISLKEFLDGEVARGAYTMDEARAHWATKVPQIRLMLEETV